MDGLIEADEDAGPADASRAVHHHRRGGGCAALVDHLDQVDHVLGVCRWHPQVGPAIVPEVVHLAGFAGGRELKRG